MAKRSEKSVIECAKISIIGRATKQSVTEGSLLGSSERISNYEINEI